jgi:hypothetical protein
MTWSKHLILCTKIPDKSSSRVKVTGNNETKELHLRVNLSAPVPRAGTVVCICVLYLGCPGSNLGKETSYPERLFADLLSPLGKFRKSVAN